MLNSFIPTWLYCKVHNQTGLRYFGKTIKNPYQYTGSGVYWKSHLKKHGNDVTTVWAHLYNDPAILKEEALFFSKIFNIANSCDWANLTEENGFTGGKLYNRTIEHNAKLSQRLVGRKFTNEHKQNIAISATGCKRGPMSQISKDKKSIALLGKIVSLETVNKMRIAALNRDKSVNSQISNTVKNLPKITCEYCDITASPGNYKRWHGINCKHRVLDK
jgi:hypothetical protein